MLVEEVKVKPVAILSSFIRQGLFIILIFLSVGLIITDNIAPQKTLVVRSVIVDKMAPILGFITSPVRGYHNLRDEFDSSDNLRAKNEKLTAENARLRKILNIAAKLKIENDKLRDMVSLLPDKKMTYVTARVVGTAYGDSGGNVIINSGSKAGLKNGQIAVNKHGLVGRLDDVGENSARVIFITDATSKIPVITQKSGVKAILSGKKNGKMHLKYVSKIKKIIIGENIVTSGDGKFFPNGINVAVVSAIKGNTVFVDSDVDFGNLEYVSIASGVQKK